MDADWRSIKVHTRLGSIVGIQKIIQWIRLTDQTDRYELVM